MHSIRSNRNKNSVPTIHYTELQLNSVQIFTESGTPLNGLYMRAKISSFWTRAEIPQAQVLPLPCQAFSNNPLPTGLFPLRALTSTLNTEARLQSMCFPSSPLLIYSLQAAMIPVDPDLSLTVWGEITSQLQTTVVSCVGWGDKHKSGGEFYRH